jgi:hypothetical protein
MCDRDAWRTPIAKIRRNRRKRANRLFRHVSNHAAAAEGFTPEFAAFLRRCTPAGTVMQHFFRHPEIFSGKEN